MTNWNDGRSVVYLDTNSLHYLDLFVRYVQDSGYTVNDIGSEALARQLEQVDEVGYRKSLQKGRRIISFVLQEDAQVELVYAGAIAARAEVLITGDGYLFHTVNLIHNPSGRARYEAIQRHLEGLTAGSLPVARDCNQL